MKFTNRIKWLNKTSILIALLLIVITVLLYNQHLQSKKIDDLIYDVNTANEEAKEGIERATEAAEEANRKLGDN